MARLVKILHVVPALFGPSGIVGGAERYAFELARQMAAAAPTRLVTFGRQDATHLIGRLEVRTLGPAWEVRGQAANPFHLRIMRELWQADVVHCHQRYIVSSSFAAAFCRLTGRRVFVSDLGGGGWDISAYLSTECWYHGHLHISGYSRKVSKHDDWDRAHVIWGGVDTTKFSPTGISAQRKSILFVGRLLPHKGISYLIDALPLGLSLRIIGKPYDEKYVEELRRLAIGKEVIFETDVDDDGLVDAYRKALCIVLPSVYRDMYGNETTVPELLGQTLLEGMACGIPAICTDVASMPEIVVDGVTGFLVPPNDPVALRAKLSWLSEHPDKARKMGEAGRKRVLARFTWDRVVRRCLDIYGAA